MQHYLNPEDASNPGKLPNIEVFFVDRDEFIEAEAGTWMYEEMMAKMEEQGALFDPDDVASDLAGWYYWFCLPGCMPDSDAFGPYDSEEAALEAAREDHE
jgi:hypothetical protein